MAVTRGEDFVRRLLTEQQMVRVENRRQLTEWVMQGRYPIAIGDDPRDVADFKANGVGLKVEKLREVGASHLQAYGVNVFKNSPHPNSTMVFLPGGLAVMGRTLLHPRGGRRYDTSARRPNIQRGHHAQCSHDIAIHRALRHLGKPKMDGENC